MYLLPPPTPLRSLVNKNKLRSKSPRGSKYGIGARTEYIGALRDELFNLRWKVPARLMLVINTLDARVYRGYTNARCPVVETNIRIGTQDIPEGEPRWGCEIEFAPGIINYDVKSRECDFGRNEREERRCWLTTLRMVMGESIFDIAGCVIEITYLAGARQLRSSRERLTHFRP